MSVVRCVIRADVSFTTILICQVNAFTHYSCNELMTWCIYYNLFKKACNILNNFASKSKLIKKHHETYLLNPIPFMFCSGS